jgi:hypothetical protein
MKALWLKKPYSLRLRCGFLSPAREGVYGMPNYGISRTTDQKNE